jgi:hypothetical protein
VSVKKLTGCLQITIAAYPTSAANTFYLNIVFQQCSHLPAVPILIVFAGCLPFGSIKPLLLCPAFPGCCGNCLFYCK